MADNTPSRIAAKLFLADPTALDLTQLIPTFHGWVQRGDVTAGLDIDVVDYAHVPNGPGVMLIGHEWDRSVDLGDGRPGVLVVSKRDLEGNLHTRVAAVVADALLTAAALADPEWLGESLAVRTTEIEITLLDRISTPNTDATLAAVGDTVAAVLAPLNGGEAPALTRVGDDRRPFKVRAALAGSGDLRAAAASVAPAGATA